MKKYLHIVFVILLFLSCSKTEDHVQLKPVIKEKTGLKKNIIFLIGDGMGLPQISAARTVNGNKLNMLRCKYVGMQATQAADKYVTDSGASGTAMACGHKANYYTLGLDANGNPISSILEIAEKNNLSTALITTTQIVHATPAVFYAHQENRFQYENIALEMINCGVDFFLGGGQKYFDQRTDGLNLIDSLTMKGYKIYNGIGDIQSSDKIAGVFIADDVPLTYLDGRGDVLPNSLDAALPLLSANKKGFFLMLEGGQIDWACEDNDQDYLLAEMLDFDRAVGKALDFAEKDGNTLVVITGDHETGGYTLVDGNLEAHTVDGEFYTHQHTGVMVPVFAFGPGAEEFTGTYENTEIFYKFLDFYGFKN